MPILIVFGICHLPLQNECLFAVCSFVLCSKEIAFGANCRGHASVQTRHDFSVVLSDVGLQWLLHHEDKVYIVVHICMGFKFPFFMNGMKFK